VLKQERTPEQALLAYSRQKRLKRGLKPGGSGPRLKSHRIRCFGASKPRTKGAVSHLCYVCKPPALNSATPKMQQALRHRSLPCRQLRPCSSASKHAVRSRTVVFADGPGSKPIREFREDTGEISVPGEDKQQAPGGALYADQVAMVSDVEGETCASPGCPVPGARGVHVVVFCGWATPPCLSSASLLSHNCAACRPTRRTTCQRR
jgi:hypothetical protein